ncbi:hypothetical protein B1C78_16090 [Thioalkalivibrio denitrificans]|uniref:Alpha/beta-hydrolase catalytic domain-containing protein n=1 Tax=Thioalkalivibrio denitrificans TaxID=108003 RepID=A0A1V3N925_9GAMM|nr:alpha/beta-hydrolase family protein [Thioalkalivibrio denitrificans]OOG21483.1 hypothetical protein B1C78_16090 [Thioalkalivibrio denitrificans]
MQLGRQFSTVGLLVGTLFFALSLTPTLVPRGDVTQGVISGLSLAAGYAVGVLGQWLWRYLELPSPRTRIQLIVKGVAAVACGLLAVTFLWQASGWQNALRELMGMEELGGLQLTVVGVTAVLVFFAALLIGRLFLWTFLFMSHRLQPFIPRRLSHLTGLVAAFALFWLVVDGVLFSVSLRTADRSYQEIDAVMEPETARPTDPLSAGGPGSLLNWEDMGRQGRRYLTGGPTVEDLGAFTNGPAQKPIRVYVGLNAGETPEERAQLALAELKRMNAFERSVLVLITPTGTGWVDPGAIDTVEYLHRGDIASVAVQYSYLPSPLALLSEGAYGAEMAQALFDVVYGYWTELPRDERPDLYLHGLSLGALNSDRSFDLYDIIDDPFQGALWSGPPFRHETWRTATQRREPGSPAWLPRFRDGSVVRFANQQGGLNDGVAPWGGFRIAFLQYASDPVTFFDPDSFYREPAWMSGPRGPDVSGDLRWFPIVTTLQLAADMIAGSAPTGFGHRYAAEHYLEAWLALTEPEGWSEEDLDRLRALFSDAR